MTKSRQARNTARKLSARPCARYDKAASRSSTGYVHLHYGSRGAAVTRLQQALKGEGYYRTGYVDGIYGDLTYAAVKEFQRDHGLAVDGIAGRKTQNALYGTNY